MGRARLTGAQLRPDGQGVSGGYDNDAPFLALRSAPVDPCRPPDRTAEEPQLRRTATPAFHDGRARRGARKIRTNCKGLGAASRAARTTGSPAWPGRAAARRHPRLQATNSQPRRQRRQMQLIGKLMRSADVEPLRQAVNEMRARPRPGLAGAASGRALARRADRRRRRGHPLDRDEHPRRHATVAQRWSHRAQGRGAGPRKRSGRAFREALPVRPRAANGAMTTKPSVGRGARDPRPHRPRLGQRSRLGRRLRRQGHPGIARLAGRARRNRSLGNAPDPRRGGESSAPRCASSSTRSIATWC